MTYYALIIFVILIISYLISFSIATRRFRNSRKYFFITAQLIFIGAGMLISPLFSEYMPRFRHYMGISSMMLISVISFISALEFRLNRLKRLSPAFAYSSMILLIGTAVPVFLFILTRSSYNRIDLAVFSLFLAGSAFSNVKHSSRTPERNAVYAAILSPPLIILLYMIINLTGRIINQDFTGLFRILLYLSALTLIIPLGNYLSRIFRPVEWVIAITAMLFIITPFAVDMHILPFLPAFIAGFIFTNLSPINADRFLAQFSAAEKPSYFILLFFAGMLIAPDLNGLFLAAAIIAIRLIMKGILLRFIGIEYRYAILLNGLGGFEFICILSLFLAAGMDNMFLYAALGVILGGQIIQGAGS